MKNITFSTEEQLTKLQRQVFSFFWNEANPQNGLVPEDNSPDCPSGIAATGLSLTCGIIAAEKGIISRNQVAERTLATLRFFSQSRSGPEPEASGHHGLYYNLLDMQKGRRAQMSGISAFENGVLFSGILASGLYFRGQNISENEIRNLAEELYLKADWQWLLNSGSILSREWKPETGFSTSRWKGYDEAMLPIILGLGSPTFPLPVQTWTDWSSSFQWMSLNDEDYLYAGPLFIHQYPQIWIDMRDIKDIFMEARDLDFFKNSTRATRVHYKYAVENPKKHTGYGIDFWGLTRSDGPGCGSSAGNTGFLGMADRGAPFGPDDGTISPWSAISSIAFEPEVVIPMIDRMLSTTDLNISDPYGFRSAYNPTFLHKPHKPHGWRSSWHNAIIQGPALPMIENFLTGFMWDLMKKSPYINRGLERAGFSGGWIDERQGSVDDRKKLHLKEHE